MEYCDGVRNDPRSCDYNFRCDCYSGVGMGAAMITELQKKMWEEHVARRVRMSGKKQKEETKEPTAAQQEEAAVSVDPDPILHYINKVRLVDIQNLVAEKYGITRNDIVSQRRAVKITFPRQIAYWLATETTPMSYSQIGRRFGPRDHTTIMHGVHKIRKMAETDERLRHDLEELKSKIMKMKNGAEK